MKLEIGEVLKAQGIKGEIKTSCYLDSPEMLKNLKQLYIGSNSYAVRNFRTDGAFGYFLLDGINDRNAAEQLRNWTVFADKDSIVLSSDRYFVQDLLGCKVLLDDFTEVGTITDILQYGAADVIVCGGKAAVSFPFVKSLCADVNLLSKTVTVNGKAFAEVAVYED